MRIMAAMAVATLLMLGSFSFAELSVVGYNAINIPASADVKLSVPFQTVPYYGSGLQDPAAVLSATGTNGVGITVAAGSLTAGQFNAFGAGQDVTKASYYVRFLTGNAAGLWMTIKNNDASSLTLDDTLAAQRTALLNRVASGDTFRIYKHQTVGSVFPPEMFGVSYVNGTTLLLYQNNIAAMQQNPPAWRQMSYTTSGGGRWLGSGVDGNTILRPETEFVLRNTAAQPLTMVMSGLAADHAVSALVAPGGDLVVGTGYPVPVVLKDSGLGGVNQRVVLFYNNQASGQNKPAVKQATYTTSGGGRWLGAGVTGNELLAPSETVKFRLPSSETSGAIVTINKPY